METAFDNDDKYDKFAGDVKTRPLQTFPSLLDEFLHTFIYPRKKMVGRLMFAFSVVSIFLIFAVGFNNLAVPFTQDGNASNYKSHYPATNVTVILSPAPAVEYKEVTVFIENTLTVNAMD